MYLNQSSLQLYQKYKNCQGKVEDGLLYQSQIIILTFKYNTLAGSSHIKLLKELDHPSEGLINIQNIDDNECFKWSLVKYLHLEDHNPARITIAEKDFTKKLDFKDIKFAVKVRDIHKIKERIPSELVLLIMKIRKNIQCMYQKSVAN